MKTIVSTVTLSSVLFVLSCFVASIATRFGMLSPEMLDIVIVVCAVQTAASVLFLCITKAFVKAFGAEPQNRENPNENKSSF